MYIEGKISGHGEHLIPGLLPVLNRMALANGINRIVPSRMRGREKPHKKGTMADIVEVKVLYVLPHGGLKCIAIGKNSRQDLIVYGDGVEAAVKAINALLQGR